MNRDFSDLHDKSWRYKFIPPIGASLTQFFMRKTLLFTLLVSGLSMIPARAQTDAGDYQTQKTRFKAARVDSLASLRAPGAKIGEKVIELRGQVKGSFARDGQRALLFQLVNNQNLGGESIVIDAPDGFNSHPATAPGSISRLLCRVQNVPGADISMVLVAATNAPETVPLFKAEDTETVVAPPAGQTLPSPDQIVIGGGGGSMVSEVPPAKIFSGPASSARSFKPRTGNALPSRGLPRASQNARAKSPFFGFDDSQRAAYKSLARRNNPKLGDAMADYIATSILNAAQTHRLDPRFLAAVVKVESSFDPYCLSSSGAMGLGQLMPFNLRPLGVSNAWDPGQNLNGSAKLLRQNLDIYARQANGTLLAVAAYHAGVGAVNRAGKAVPPRASTQKYVWKVYYAYRALAPELFAP